VSGNDVVAGYALVNMYVLNVNTRLESPMTAARRDAPMAMMPDVDGRRHEGGQHQGQRHHAQQRERDASAHSPGFLNSDPSRANLGAMEHEHQRRDAETLDDPHAVDVADRDRTGDKWKTFISATLMTRCAGARETASHRRQKSRQNEVGDHRPTRSAIARAGRCVRPATPAECERERDQQRDDREDRGIGNGPPKTRYPSAGSGNYRSRGGPRRSLGPSGRSSARPRTPASRRCTPTRGVPGRGAVFSSASLLGADRPCAE